VVADLLSATIAWGIFYFYRKAQIESVLFGYIPFQPDDNFFLGITLLPILWVIVYALMGTYNDIYRKSRLKEFGQTFIISIIGCLIIFFTLLLDDTIISYKSYYSSFVTLFLLQFGITFTVRFIITTLTARKIKSRKIGFNTIIIGSSQKAVSLFNELESEPLSQGYKFIGFVHVDKY